MTRDASLVLLCALCLCPGRAGAAAPFVPDDPLPEGAILRLGTSRLRHPAPIDSLAISPDLRTLASADGHGRVRLWDLRDGRLLLDLPKAGAPVAFSADGRAIAVAGRYGNRQSKAVRLLDARTGKLIRTFGELTGGCVAFSPHGRTIAGADDKRRVVVCDLESGRVIRRFEGLKNPPLSIAFSGDGTALAAGEYVHRDRDTSTVIVWELATGKERSRLTNQLSGSVSSVAFSPDSKEVAWATPFDPRLYYVRRDQFRADATSAGADVAFDNDGRRFTSGFDGVYVTKQGKTTRLLGWERCPPGRLAVSADGKLIATTRLDSNRVRVWDGRTGEERLVWTGHANDVAGVTWGPDGRRVVTASRLDGTVRLWDAATGASVWRAPLLEDDKVQWLRARRALSRINEDHLALGFSPDGRTVLTPGRRLLAADGSLDAPLPMGEQLVYSPDGSRAVLAVRDRLEVQDADGRTLRRLGPVDRSRLTRFKGMAFSPDGRTLAVGCSGERGEGDSVRLCDVATGKEVLSLRPAGDAPDRIAFSPDGALLATHEARGGLQLFDARTGREVCRLGADRDRDWREPVPLAFSPDSALLATGGSGGSIVLWEAVTGREVRTLPGHDGRTLALCFSPDGRRLLSGGADAVAFVWRVLPAAPKEAWDRGTPERLWAALAKDPPEAYAAVAALAASPEGVGVLEGKLKPDDDVDPGRIDKLIDDLDDDDFEVRQKAERDLKALGARAESALRAAMRKEPSLEQRHRIRRLLARLDKLTADELRERRAIQALAHAGTPRAEALLEKLSRGAETGRKARAAVAALERLEAARRRAESAAARPVPQGRAPVRLGAHEGAVNAFAFAPDGKTAVSVGGDGVARRWDLVTAKALAFRAVHEGGVLAVAASADGKRLATAGADGRVCLLRLPGLGLERALKGHDGPVLCVAFSPDGKTVASGGDDGDVRSWATADGKPAEAAPRSRSEKVGKGFYLSRSEKVGTVAFTSEGRLLAGTPAWGRALSDPTDAPTRGLAGSACVWSVEGRGVVKHEQEGYSIRLFAGGRLALATVISVLPLRSDGEKASSHVWSARLVLCETTRGKELMAAPGCSTADVSPDGRWLLTGPGHPIPVEYRYRDRYQSGLHPEARLWEVASGGEVLRFAVKDVTAAALAPDGRRALLGTKSGAVYLADLTPPGAGEAKATDAALWGRLGGKDAAAAYAAGLELIARGDAGAKFLAGRFASARADDPVIRGLIADLSAERHVVRRDAFAELAARGAEAVPALKAALKQAKEAKARRKIEELLAAPTAARRNDLQLARAEWVLDRIGTAEAAKAKRALTEWRK
jgi:WD40 repeat protein